MFKKKDAESRPKWVVNNYIDSAKCGADVADAKEFIKKLATVGNHNEKELYDYFVNRMQNWGRNYKKPSKKTA